jgi:hypothetical protein
MMSRAVSEALEINSAGVSSGTAALPEGSKVPPLWTSFRAQRQLVLKLSHIVVQNCHARVRLLFH